MNAADLAASLDDLGIALGWEIGDQVRAAAATSPDAPCLGEPAARRVEAFRNLVVGTIAERAFREQHLAPLETAGFEIIDYHERGENRDFGVQRDGLEVPINVKVASTRFREARRVVGLDPDDCIPVGAYKAIGASEHVGDLLYVFLVDFDLREKVDAFMDRLEDSLGIGWDLFSWYAGRGAKKAQDRYNATLFDRRGLELMALAPEVTKYRAISALRVLAIMGKNPRRVPGLGVKAAGRGVFQAEVNIHVSVENETKSWSEVADELKQQGIQHLLDKVRRRQTTEVSDPLL